MRGIYEKQKRQLEDCTEALDRERDNRLWRMEPVWWGMRAFRILYEIFRRRREDTKVSCNILCFTHARQVIALYIYCLLYPKLDAQMHRLKVLPVFTAVTSGLALKVGAVVPTAKLRLRVWLRGEPCAVLPPLAVAGPKLVGGVLTDNFIVVIAVANGLPVRAAVAGFLTVEIRVTVPAAELIVEAWIRGKPQAILEAVIVVDKEGGVWIILAGESRYWRRYRGRYRRRYRRRFVVIPVPATVAGFLAV